MKVATILFTYKRPWHTKQVLDGLAKNTILPEKLFIFQDGLKPGHKREEWYEVKEIIHNVFFCPTEIVEEKVNKGLACSIVDGINYVLNEYDAVIVLEDDCIPMPSFMEYMNRALAHYQNSEKVNVISGYSYHLFEEKKAFESFFIGRMPTWGWGTWRDCWKEYNKDTGILNRIYADKKALSRLNVWAGFDLDVMLKERLSGNNDSWAVFWALRAIEIDKYALMPNRSLVKNIGFDGTGVHCGKEMFSTSKIQEDIITDFVFPDILRIDNAVKEKAIRMIGNGFYFNHGDANKEHVIVYGAGSSLHNNYRFLYDNFYVEAIIDKNKRGSFGVVPIHGPDYLKNVKDTKIIIMIDDRNVCMDVVNTITEAYGIPRSNIVLGVNLRNKCTSETPFNVGIMGCGSIASQMAATILNMRKDINVWACASRSQEKAEEFAFKYAIDQAYGDYRDMLEDDKLNLIYIATPISEHYENMMMCIEKGKNILCEKAFTVNAAQAREILERAEEKGVYVGEAMSICYHPLYAKLKDILATKIIGNILNVYAGIAYKAGNPKRILKPVLAGGALLDLGIYTLNFVKMLLGTDIKKMTAYSKKNDADVDVATTILIQYENGVTAELYCDTRCFGNNQGIIYGEKGYIVIDELNRPLKICVYDSDRNLVEEHKAELGESGLENEIIVAKNAIERKELECSECSHKHIIEIMCLMDKIRKQMDRDYLFDSIV